MLDGRRTVAPALHTSNYARVVEAACQLNMPMLNIHLAPALVGRQSFIDFVRRGVDGGKRTAGGLCGELKTTPGSTAWTHQHLTHTATRRSAAATSGGLTTCWKRWSG